MNLDKYTQKSQEALLMAQRLAQELNHQSIEPAHLLLALIKEENTIAARCLRNMNIDFNKVKREVLNLIEGNYRQVLEFLDALTYGERSTPGLRETLTDWRETVDRVARLWNDQRWLNRRQKSGKEGD